MVSINLDDLPFKNSKLKELENSQASQNMGCKILLLIDENGDTEVTSAMGKNGHYQSTIAWAELPNYMMTNQKLGTLYQGAVHIYEESKKYENGTIYCHHELLSLVEKNRN